MKKNILIVSLIFISIFCISSLFCVGYSYAYKENGHISLLTVAESPDNSTVEHGGVADLYLSIKRGTGRIFIDSFPISKVDTQITMRFASEMSCDFLNIDCSSYDFFYTIRADSAIVGGPSAGAAATVLTVSMLDNQNLDDKTVMTGTINSGYLVGPVAGISAKTLAAQGFGFTKVLIPRWDVPNETVSPDLKIKLVPVSTLEDALFEFTGKNYSTTAKVIDSEKYDSMMKQVTIDICSKYGSVDGGIIIMPNITSMISGDVNLTGGNDTNVTANVSEDFFSRAKDAIDNKQYYSAASFCFGGNVRIATSRLSNLSNNDLKRDYAELLGKISVYNIQLDDKAKNLSTISELETYMVVKERLAEASDILSKVNPENITASDIAYADERYSTALIWSRFFDLPGTKFIMDNDSLKNVCTKKIAEAEERINYLELYFPKVDRTEINKAYDYYNDGDYALCIFTASKAKADTDVVLSAIFVNDKNIGQLVDEKLTAAQNVIAKQESHDVFPILGYSYYGYAITLKDTEQYSSLIYAEYALELSNLDMYFPRANKSSILNNIDPSYVSVLLLGFALGILFVVIIATIYRKSVKHATKTKASPISSRRRRK